MLVERRDECHVAAPGDLARDVETGEPWHLDIQEGDRWCVLLDCMQGGDAVGRARDDLQARPEGAEVIHELVGEHRLVFRDDSGRGVLRRIRSQHGRW